MDQRTYDQLKNHTVSEFYEILEQKRQALPETSLFEGIENIVWESYYLAVIVEPVGNKKFRCALLVSHGIKDEANAGQIRTDALLSVVARKSRIEKTLEKVQAAGHALNQLIVGGWVLTGGNYHGNYRRFHLFNPVAAECEYTIVQLWYDSKPSYVRQYPGHSSTRSHRSAHTSLFEKTFAKINSDPVQQLAQEINSFYDKPWPAWRGKTFNGNRVQDQQFQKLLYQTKSKFDQRAPQQETQLLLTRFPNQSMQALEHALDAVPGEQLAETTLLAAVEKTLNQQRQTESATSGD